MSIEILRLLTDFGMVVLIWIVQRIVYPSFLYYSPKELIIWHRIYTSRFTFIVFPLMVGQLAISGYQLFLEINLYTVLSSVIIGLLWLSTFLQFVPIHAEISKGNKSQNFLNSLVSKNWIRTFLWTALFLYTILFLSLNQ